MEPIRPHTGVSPLEKRSKRSSGFQARVSTRGFTLVELLVVVAIMTVVMSIVITGQNSFNNSLVVSNTAYDVALAIRSTETFGLGSRVVSGVANVGYGVDFNSSTPAVFTIFADTDTAPGESNCHTPQSGVVNAPDTQPGDCVYDASDSKVAAYTLGNGVTVTRLCGFSNSAWNCNLSSLDIVFARPNPTPFMRANGSSVTEYSQACITLTSPQGGTRFLRVLSSGQIDTSADVDCTSLR